MKKSPRPYQVDMHNSVIKHLEKGIDQQIIVQATGCHAKGTKILMFDGTVKNVEDIKPNDLIMGNDSMPREVLSLARGNETMYRIIPNKGESFVVNEGHILALKQTSGGNYTNKYENIVLKDYINKSNNFKHCYKLQRKAVDFIPFINIMDNESPTLMYWIGLWLGDGNRDRPQITNPDQEIADFFYDEFDEYCLWYTNPRVNINKIATKDRCDVYSFVTKIRESNPMLDLISTLVINDEKRITRKYLLQHKNQRIHLLAGIIDSDGHLSNGGYEIITKYKGLCQDILFLARSLGFAAYSSIKIGKIKSLNFEGNYYRIYISGNTDQIPCKVKRKQAKPRKQKKDVLMTGFKVEKLPEADFYGFALSGNHLYLTEDFTVHHNTGKTFGSCALIHKMRFKRTLWLTHREELIDQSGKALAMTFSDNPKEIDDYIETNGGLFSTLNRLNSMFATGSAAQFIKKNMGIIKRERMDVDKPLVVASMQTLYRRLDKIDPNSFDCIICDEVHLFMAKTYKQCVDHFNVKLRLGLTATPHRADGLSLYGLFKKITFEYDLAQAIREGWLVEINGIRCKTQINIDTVHTRIGEFVQSELSQVVDCPERNNLIVDKYLEYAKDKQAIFYCVDINHAKNLADTFYRRGLQSVNVVVSDKKITPDRKDIIRKFKKGEIKILTNVDILTTGFDYPDLGVVGMACPTKSLVKYIQSVGRGTRPQSGILEGKETIEERIEAIKNSQKPNLTLLDFVDVTSRHSLINAWELDRKKDPEERTFITKEIKDKLIEAREKRKFDAVTNKDVKVNLIPLPKLKYSTSPKMQDDATPAQINLMKSRGVYEEGVHYTKGDASYAISNLPISEGRVNWLIKQGYDAPMDTTFGQYKLILDKIDKENKDRMDKINKKKILDSVKGSLPDITEINF